MIQLVTTIISAVGTFLYPHFCIVCGLPSGNGTCLCDICAHSKYLAAVPSVSFTMQEPTRCTLCGRPLISCHEKCCSCRETAAFSAIDRILPLFPYTPESQELLTFWKIKGHRLLTSFFASCFATALNQVDKTQYILVPVPPRPGKIREKGWDQMQDIAWHLERQYGLNVLHCLYRSTCIQQKKLGREQRKLNMSGTISVSSSHHVLPKTVIIIDDLMTTGATLDACAHSLKEAGCEKVFGITLFHD